MADPNERRLTVRQPSPGTALIDPRRPNWTAPPEGMRAPGPIPVGETRVFEQAVPDSRVAEAARARTAAIPTGSAQPVPAAPPVAADAPSKFRRVVNGARGATGFGTALAPGLAGAAVAAKVNGMRQQELDNRPAFVPPANQNAPGQIPVDPTQTGPAPVAGRFGDQTELRRNVFNAAMALPGGAAGMAAAPKLAGLVPQFATRGMQAVKTGVDVAKAAGLGFVAADAAGLGTSPTAPASPTPTSTNSGAAEAAAMSMRRGNARDAAQPTGVPDGAIVRDGNSYSGAPGIKFGADIVDPNGKVLNTSEGKGTGFGVSSLDTSEGHRQNLLELQRNATEREAQAQDPMRNRPAMQVGGRGYGSIREGGPGGGQGGEDIAGMLKSGKINALQARAMVDAQQANQAIPLAQLRADTDLATNANTNATSRANNQESNRVSMRGQDAVAGSARARGQLDAQKAQRDQANEDRRYGFDVAKFGEEAAGKNADRRRAATKDLTEEIGNMLPPGADGKPDGVKVAQYAEGLNAMLASQEQAARAELQRNPNNAAAASFLDNIAKNGAGAMDATAKRKYIAGMQANQQATDNAGNWLPWKGEATGSVGPVAGLRKREGFIWDDYQVLDERGQPTKGVIPGSVVDKDRNLKILER